MGASGGLVVVCPRWASTAVAQVISFGPVLSHTVTH